jgi:hypothetical protein
MKYKMTFGKSIFILLTSSFLLLSGCYSFTGASIPAWIHTIAVPIVEDNSGFGQSDIRQNLTNKLIQEFTSEGSLQVADRSHADAVLEASIPAAGILDESVSVKSGELVTDKKITIKVHAIYRDQKKSKVFWERDFSQISTYQISAGLAGQKKAINDAEDLLTKTLVTAVISNW